MTLKHIDQDGIYPGGKRGLPGRAAMAIVNENSAETEERLSALESGTGGVVDDIEALQSGLTSLDARVDLEQEALAALAGRVSGKNRLINGDFKIWQRPEPLPAATGARFSADRWMTGAAGSTIEVSRLVTPQYGGQALADTGSNARFILACVVASVAGAGNSVYLQQRVEDVRTLAGKVVTVSFKARSTLPEFKVGVEFSQVFGIGGSPQLNGPRGVVAVTSEWKTHQITLTLPSVVGNTLGTGNALQLTLWLDAGANLADRASGIGQKSGTLYITDIQLEEGGSATGFDWRPEAYELALCRRYCVVETVGGNGAARLNLASGFFQNSTTFYGLYHYPPMRTSPSVVIAAPSAWRILIGNSAVNVTSLAAAEVSKDRFTLIATCPAVTAGAGGIVQTIDSPPAGSGIYLDAEL